MAKGWVGLDWLQDESRFPVSKGGWQTSLARGKSKINPFNKELKLQESFKKHTGLDWNRDILNQAGRGWSANFLPGASASSIRAISKLPEAQQAAIGFAQDYGGYVSPAYAAKRATTGAESVIDAKGITGDAATSGGAAPSATPWAAISMGLNFLAKLTDKSKKGQPGPRTGNLNLMANSNDWTQFFS